MIELRPPIVNRCSACGASPTPDRFCDLVQITVGNSKSGVGIAATLCHDCAHQLIEKLLGRYYALWGQALMFSDAVEAEREACAVAIDAIRLKEKQELESDESWNPTPTGYAIVVARAQAFKEAAAAIRARGSQEGK